MTLHLDDARWRAAIDADAVGEANDEQRALIRDHAPAGAEHRAEQQLLAALRDDELANERLDDEASLIASAVDAFIQPAPTAAREVRVEVPAEVRSRSRWWKVAAVGAGIAAAAAAVVLLTGVPDAPASSPAEVTMAAPSSEGATAEPPLPEGTAPPPPPSPPAPAIRPSTGWAIASGRLTGPKGSGTGLPMGTGLEADEGLCLSRGAGRACLDRGARFEAKVDGPLMLHAGRAEVSAKGQSDDAPDFAVALDDVTITPSQDTVVVIERSVAGWSVSVQSGDVTVVEQRSERVVRAGEVLRRPSASTPPPPLPPRASAPKAGELLRLARAERRAGDLDGALSTYARLTRLHPKSSAARAAAVSIGQLHLQRGDAKSALAAFRRYLAAGGRGLAEDAAYGEIGALRALGKQAAAATATDRFLRTYPESHYGAKLRP